MRNLPVELVGMVMKNVTSDSDLLSLRSVSSAFCDLVTPHAFREINIRNSVESAQKCQNILASPSLATHVHEIVYGGRDYERSGLLPSGAEGTRHGDELEIADLEDALVETFSSLPGFKNLQSVVLNFWPSFRSRFEEEIQDHPFGFSNHQIAVLHALHLGIKSSSVRSFTLNGIILILPAGYDIASPVANSPLHHLSMSIVKNSELCVWSESMAYNSLCSLLPPSNSNLKSLVLRSPQGLYHSLNQHFRSFKYPALEKLVLENIVFDLDPGGVEDFIVQHKASLRRLELYSCFSYVPGKVIPVRSWSTIWTRLEEELVLLTEVVTNSAWQGTSHGLAQQDEQAYLRFTERVNSLSAVARNGL